jgi:hypothetical protein
MMDEEDVVEEFGWRKWRNWFRHRRPWQRRRRQQNPIFRAFTQYNNSNIRSGGGTFLETQSGNLSFSLSNCLYYPRDACDAVVRIGSSNILWGSNVGMEGFPGATTYMKK